MLLEQVPRHRMGLQGSAPRVQSRVGMVKEYISEGRWRITACQPDSSEKAMAPHSSTLAWKIPWMEEPGRLQSMGSLKVRYI